jgi:hypothetical protein
MWMTDVHRTLETFALGHATIYEPTLLLSPQYFGRANQ